jgi:hypothetical protein
VSGSQFGGASGFSTGGRGSGDAQYGYFGNTTATPGSSVTPATGRLGGPVTAGPAGFGSVGPGSAPAAVSALPTRGVLDHGAVRAVLGLLVAAAIAFGGFTWYHRNDPVLPGALGVLPRTNAADFQPEIDAAQKQASLEGQDFQVAAAAYGTAPTQAVLMIFRKEGVANLFGAAPLPGVHSFGAESCLTSQVTTECIRVAGDLLVMVMAPAKIPAADVAGWTEEAFRAQ